jgi:hypothetical protein
VPAQRTERQRIGNQINAAFIFTRAHFVNVHLIGAYKNSHFSRKRILPTFDIPLLGREKYKPHIRQGRTKILLN